jgi:hypothetical protein
MQKTSRRDFSKLIVGAATTLPLISSAGSSAEVQDTNKETRTTQAGIGNTQGETRENHRNHQDTPPPIILEEGSLKLDVLDRNLGSGEELPKHPSGNYYRWEFPTSASEIYIVGVQIVTGAGKTLFYLDRDGVDGPEKLPLHILVHMEGDQSHRQELAISTEGKYVTFKVPTDRMLKKTHLAPGGPYEPGSSGRARFRYLENTGAEKWKMEGVAVGIGPAGAHRVITRFKREDFDPAIQGAQVRMWFEKV